MPSSDVDLIVLLRNSTLPFLDRIPRYSPVVGELAVDVLPYTLAEWSAMRADDHPLIRAAMREGEWLVGG